MVSEAHQFNLDRRARAGELEHPWDRVDRIGNLHWHTVPKSGSFQLRSACDACDVLAPD